MDNRMIANRVSDQIRTKRILREGKTDLRSLHVHNGHIQYNKELRESGQHLSVYKDGFWKTEFISDSKQNLKQSNKSRLRNKSDSYNDFIDLLYSISSNYPSYIKDITIQWMARFMQENVKNDNSSSRTINENHQHLFITIFTKSGIQCSSGISKNDKEYFSKAEVFYLMESLLLRSKHDYQKPESLENQNFLILNGAASLLIQKLLGQNLELQQSVKNHDFPILHPTMNLHDRVSDKDLFVSYKHDQEGIRARDKTLINSGLIVNNMDIQQTITNPDYELFSGNARASSISESSIPRMRNIELMPGTISLDEAKSTFDKGFIVTCGSANSRISYENDYFWMEIEHATDLKGEKCYRFAISGSIKKSLKNIIPLNDAQYVLSNFSNSKGQSVPVSSSSPSLILSGVDIIKLY